MIESVPEAAYGSIQGAEADQVPPQPAQIHRRQGPAAFGSTRKGLWTAWWVPALVASAAILALDGPHEKGG